MVTKKAPVETHQRSLLRLSLYIVGIASRMRPTWSACPYAHIAPCPVWHVRELMLPNYSLWRTPHCTSYVNLWDVFISELFLRILRIGKIFWPRHRLWTESFGVIDTFPLLVAETDSFARLLVQYTRRRWPLYRSRNVRWNRRLLGLKCRLVWKLPAVRTSKKSAGTRAGHI